MVTRFFGCRLFLWCSLFIAVTCCATWDFKFYRYLYSFLAVEVNCNKTLQKYSLAIHTLVSAVSYFVCWRKKTFFRSYLITCCATWGLVFIPIFGCRVCRYMRVHMYRSGVWFCLWCLAVGLKSK